MKATVYAVVDAVVHAAVEANAGPSRSSRWKWRISLDFGTDLRYWQTGSARQAGQAGWAGQVGLAGQAGLAGTAGRVGRSGPVRTIYKLEPPLPLGVALDLARALDQRGCLPSGGKNPESETKSNSWLEAFCETVLRLLRHCCELRGIEPPAADSVRLAKAAAEQLSAAVVPEERGASGRAAEMMRFAQFLQGRAVIPEEIAGFLRRQGVERADEVWPSFVQFAYLRGWATIGCGLRPEFVRSKWSLVRRLVYTCERCGNTERMRRSLCATCGQMCMYCEACLNMGRVRECTPLVVGPAPPMPAISSELPGKLLGGLSGEPEDLTAGGIGTKKGMEKESMPGVTVPSAALVISLVPDRPEAPVPSCPVSCRVPDLSRWGLSEAQREAVRQAFRFLRRCREGREPPPREFLIWAVTGAGKTEMLFPLIEDAIWRGESVLIATPRKDVVKELEPRLRKAFPHAPPVALYGGSEAKWESGPVMLATTHQLLRFRHFFDLVVIDELDAFPYHNNPMLQHAAGRAGKPGAPRILLTATPPASLAKLARRGRLPHVKVPVRYHRHPLPVPSRLRVAPAQHWIRRGQLPAALRRRLRQSLERGAQVFLFVPRIALVDPLVRLLEARFPEWAVEGVSSRDAERHDKVLRFRERTTHMLVTTTILERGVTVKRSDVYIADADDRLFDAAALIQMAGRAGRSAEDPAGKVWFLSGQWTGPQRQAIRNIRMMNRTAKKAGYLQ